MPSLGQVFPIAEDRNVEVAAIESELRRLLAGNRKDEDDSAVLRVCTLNLVAIAQDARSASRASEAGPAITARYPCRVIVATADAGGENTLESSISAYCHGTGEGSRPICCERITLYAGGESVQRLPWVIIPLLAPDVPVFVWFQGDPHPEGEVYRRLVRAADRLIVDLQAIPHAENFLPHLIELDGKRPAATDLAWRRTAAWRERVATLFDAPANRAFIPDLREAQIGYVPGGAGWPQAQAALIGAWICDRLDWRPEGAIPRDGDTWTIPGVTPSGEKTKVTISPEPQPGAAPGEVTAIRFPECATCNIVFTLERSASGELVQAQIQRPDVEALIWNRPLEGQDVAGLLGQELERPHGSVAFERVIRLLHGIFS